jgi:xylulose-5-phosphate/fructose-6-phosphate phosphoketolase
MHVRGYKEQGNINTPLELAIANEIDRFSLAMDAIKRVPRLQRIGSHVMDKFRNMQIAFRNYAYQHGTDNPDVANWKWPY